MRYSSAFIFQYSTVQYLRMPLAGVLCLLGVLLGVDSWALLGVLRSERGVFCSDKGVRPSSSATCKQ